YNRGTGQWTIHCNNQFPGFAAIMMGPALRCGLDKLRFVTQDIGGGFGNKITSHPQLVAICLLARKLNRPVQWTEWRTEFHLTMSHGNERWFLDTEVAVKDDGTLLGFRTKALDDAGAFTRYEPLGGVIWAQVTPGMYRWRNCRLDFTQVVTNKAPCSPNRGYSRMQHLWFTERVIDIVAHELGIDPVEMRKRNYVRADEMPYTTPNGCVYDSGDYAAMLDQALELLGGGLEERRRDAEGRGRLLGVGIGSTLDSGTNNFGQSRLINPELQFSGNNEVATVKLDIFGEIVVTIGTTPQGQSHETTAAMVVADILGVSPDDVNVRAGHDDYWNSHAGFSGTYASQFAVTGLGAVKGAADRLAADIRTLAAAILQTDGPEHIVLEGGFAKRDDDPEAALPFMALGAIVNANNAILPPEAREITLNSRFVYVPPFEVPDVERKYGNLTLTYAAQVHVAVVEVDPETGVYEIVEHVAVDDCGIRIHPQIVEGQVMGATAHGIGAATHETFTYDEDGNLLTPNFYDYHVPHAMDVPPLKTGFLESPSPFSDLGTKGMGEGGGAAIHAICAALQDALKGAGAPVVYDSCNPYHRVWELLSDPEASRARVEVTPA
ncbi:MAG: xanthine dehydrogenase family protein molybdopterin-binding subunit, partial [Gaiellaceae bacterium]